MLAAIGFRCRAESATTCRRRDRATGWAARWLRPWRKIWRRRLRLRVRSRYRRLAEKRPLPPTEEMRLPKFEPAPIRQAAPETLPPIPPPAAPVAEAAPPPAKARTHWAQCHDRGAGGWMHRRGDFSVLWPKTQRPLRQRHWWWIPLFPLRLRQTLRLRSRLRNNLRRCRLRRSRRHRKRRRARPRLLSS